VRQHGTGPAGQHGGQPISLGTQQGVADRVDAAVQATEPLRAHPLDNPLLSNADMQQLRSRHKSVLPIDDRGQPMLNGG
jgi:hypothetical protein